MSSIRITVDGQYGIVPAWALERCGTPAEVAVYSAICTFAYAAAGGEASVSRKDIARRSHVYYTTVSKVAKRLHELGVLTVEDVFMETAAQLSNVYHVHMAPQEPRCPESTRGCPESIPPVPTEHPSRAGHKDGLQVEPSGSGTVPRDTDPETAGEVLWKDRPVAHVPEKGSRAGGMGKQKAHGKAASRRSGGGGSPPPPDPTVPTPPVSFAAIAQAEVDTRRAALAVIGRRETGGQKPPDRLLADLLTAVLDSGYQRFGQGVEPDVLVQSLRRSLPRKVKERGFSVGMAVGALVGEVMPECRRTTPTLHDVVEAVKRSSG